MTIPISREAPAIVPDNPTQPEGLSLITKVALVVAAIFAFMALISFSTVFIQLPAIALIGYSSYRLIVRPIWSYLPSFAPSFYTSSYNSYPPVYGNPFVRPSVYDGPRVGVGSGNRTFERDRPTPFFRETTSSPFTAGPRVSVGGGDRTFTPPLRSTVPMPGGGFGARVPVGAR